MSTVTETPTQAKTEPTDPPEIEYLSIAETIYMPKVKFRNLVVAVPHTAHTMQQDGKPLPGGNIAYRVGGTLTLHLDREDFRAMHGVGLDIDFDVADVSVQTDTGVQLWLSLHDDVTDYDPELDQAILEAILEAMPEGWIEYQRHAQAYERGSACY